MSRRVHYHCELPPATPAAMRPFDFHFPPRIVGGVRAVDELGVRVRELRGSCVLLVADPECAGPRQRIAAILERDGLSVVSDEREAHADLLVTVGANSPGGAAGIRRPVVHVPSLMTGGSRDGSARVADDVAIIDVVVLDPEMSVGTSREAIAGAMLDATTRAIEAWGSTRRTAMSDFCAREAWRQLASSVPRLLNAADDLDAMSAALLGSFLAATAAEHSTLGAVHACARPVSRRYGVPHGTALALLLPAVVRWNSRVVADRYAELAAVRGESRRPETLVARLEDLVAAGDFPERLAAAGVVEGELPALAVEASADQVGEFNPRKFDVAGALEIYAAAY
jgi:alcohol dehydrogenase class IV